MNTRTENDLIRLMRPVAVAVVAVSMTWTGGCIGTQSTSKGRVDTTKETLVTVRIPASPAVVDPMIYGEMLEDCNDQIIYGGVVDADGGARPQVDALIRPLQIPVVRWPGGTYVKEYHWKKAIGPLDQRPVTEDYAWKGKDNNRFGTDEFLRWCKTVGTQAYINFNMGNQVPYGGTLQEALDWVEYVNGSTETPYGKKRAENGHAAPYQVKYWGLGNENYGSYGRHDKETDTVYAEKLSRWASAIGSAHPDLKLLAVGYTQDWDQTVLEKAGNWVDFLTQHYYVTSRIKDGRVQTPLNSLFAPAKMEAHLQMLTPLFKKVNAQLGRTADPIRISIDEWDNRHSNFDGKKYRFNRHDPRNQFDAAVVASMLNVFIRQSPLVGMTNYIFPVNGHGLIRTVGDTGAFKSAIYPVFFKYRQWMTGNKLGVSVKGPGVLASDLKFFLSGDATEADLNAQQLSFIDASATQGSDGTLTIALVNRNPDAAEAVTLAVPEGYTATAHWTLESDDINRANTATERNNVYPTEGKINHPETPLKVTLRPCGVQLTRFNRQ